MACNHKNNYEMRTTTSKRPVFWCRNCGALGYMRFTGKTKWHLPKKNRGGRMKNEELIRTNFNGKIGGWLAGKEWHSPKLERDIVMLDWVLSEHRFIRTIEDIIKEYRENHRG